MIDNNFSTTVQNLLLFIADTIEEYDLKGDYDVELKDGILDVVIDSQKFVLNRHSASRQLWLSSPISGPHHFSFKNGQWITKNEIELFQLLQKELRIEF